MTGSARRWVVYSQRTRTDHRRFNQGGTEAPRAGLGNDELRKTLRHLGDRGDERATVWLPQPDEAGSMVDVDLSEDETWPTAPP